MTITSTVIEIVSSGQHFNIPGDMAPEAVINAYSDTIQGLRNMEHTTTIVGDQKTITFKPRTGTKGAITVTRIDVVSVGQEFTIPGDMSPEAVVNAYSSTIQGLGNMQADVRIEGSQKTITFRPRTGTKG
jgi:hypothetical protein